MEGIVAKLAKSPYKSVNRRSPWIKIKNSNYTQKESGIDLQPARSK